MASPSPFLVSGTTQLTPSLSFLTSPIIEIVVGKGDNETSISAHQNLLVQAPKLAELVAGLTGSDAVSDYASHLLTDVN